MTRTDILRAVVTPLLMATALIWFPARSPLTSVFAGDPELTEPPVMKPKPKPKRKANPHPKVPRVKPEPSPSEEPEEPEARSSPPEAALLDRAQAAFQRGCFAEPPAENAIELARLAMQVNPANTTGKLVEVKAARAYEALAKEAATRKDTARACAMFERLLELYPDNAAYRQQAKAAKRPSIAGTWRWVATKIISAQAATTFAEGGGCHIVGGLFNELDLPGVWVCTDPKTRTFVVTWQNNIVDTVSMTEDGRKLEGRSSNFGARIRATRLSGQ